MKFEKYLNMVNHELPNDDIKMYFEKSMIDEIGIIKHAAYRFFAHGCKNQELKEETKKQANNIIVNGYLDFE